MGYLAVTDLKKTRALGAQLESEREIIVTRDGKPMARQLNRPYGRSGGHCFGQR